MEVHYCMGKQSGIEFYSTTSNEKCKRCGMTEKKGGCCSDELKFYKIQDSHKNSSNQTQLFFIGDPMLNQYSIVFGALVYHSKIDNKPSVVFPVISSPPIYIKNCVFRL